MKIPRDIHYALSVNFREIFAGKLLIMANKTFVPMQLHHDGRVSVKAQAQYSFLPNAIPKYRPVISLD